ncbi:2-oxoacid:acceptor oxidoreductase subunit alpha [Terricaulis sp.]|uniref:2-oxoacid:acceptor oxidoreductase subunit alpha n=1 Tax=Terricaulis sp. TaxID=2768686 RepID=UPI003783705D
MSKPITATNDFVVKFANVNGSGSASANGLFAKVILRMGVPVGARNIFPSNIQGLPTWYEVRVNEAGWLGRRGGVDLMVAMNPQTWDGDVKEIEPGGYLLHDSSKPLPASKFRDDITVIGAPLTELIAAEFADPRQRQLFKNICYVGVLAQLLGFETEVVQQLLQQEFKGKDKLIQPNFKAFELGRAYAEANLAPIGLKVRRADKVGDRIFVEGNEAAALGAVYGGATFCAWYPITPSTSLAEGFQKHCNALRKDADGKNRFAIVQAEDEIASIGMVMGAGWAGSRAFTCTSGPGISLMNEFVGFSYYAEIPAVIFDVQRGGPSTGMPTRTQQSDLLLAAYASHGDTKHPMLFPANPTEAFEMGAQSFDLADFFQTTVFVMLELDIGMQEWLTAPFKWDEKRRLNRGKVLTYEHLEQNVPFGRYRDVDGDAVPYRTYPGTHPTKGSYFTRGSSHDKDARYSEKGADYVEGMERLLRKWETMKAHVPAPIRRDAKGRTLNGVIYIGSTEPAMDEALHALEAQGIHLDALRIRAFPFSNEVFDFIRTHDQVFVVEQNRDGQLRSLLVNEGDIDPAVLVSVRHYDGTPITARFIIKDIGDKLKAQAALSPEKAS